MGNHTQCFLIDIQLFAEKPGDPGYKFPIGPVDDPDEDADTVDDEGADAQDAPTAADDKTVEPAEDTTEDEEITVKYNKQELKIKKSEQAALIQKGLNYEKVHGRMSAAEAQLAQLNDWVRRTYGTQGISSVQEWQQAIAEKELREKLEEQGIDPDEYDKIIKNDPKIKALQEQNEAYQRQLQQQQNMAAFNERVTREIAELNDKYGLKVSTLDEVAKLKNSNALIEYVEKNPNMTLADAYFLANREEIIEKRTQTAKREEKVKASSTSHIKPAAKGGDDIEYVAVDPETMAFYKRLNPKATEREIKEHFAKSIKKKR